jgi:multiple antibiotic resistance protein
VGVPDVQLFWSTLLTLFVILDPPGLLPVFLGLTATLPARERNRAAFRASLVALGVIGIFAVFGRYILDYLHISVEAMQVSGGFLLLLVALQLLMGAESKTTETEGINVAVVPLGTPLLAGPGAIVATMLAVSRASSWLGYLLVGAALVGALVLVYLFLRFAGVIRLLLRESGTVLASRIAGLLLSAIAVQMIADGIFGMVAAH